MLVIYRVQPSFFRQLDLFLCTKPQATLTVYEDAQALYFFIIDLVVIEVGRFNVHFYFM